MIGDDAMQCKSCSREIPDNSIFCNWCGERQIRERKKKTEIRVPKPVQLASGKWNIYLRAEGQSVTEDTPDLCTTKAKAIRAGFLEAKRAMPYLTLKKGITDYIKSNDAVLSPSTLRGYAEIGRNRFKAYQAADITSIDWQKAINAEAKLCSPKTLRNAWGLVARVMRSNGLQPPDVRLPQIARKELPWLNYKQIEQFLKAVQGAPCEMAALLALHSLRRSELLAITPAKVDADGIHVSGARVLNQDGKLVEKETNKNANSARVVPIMIPRLQELFDISSNMPDQPYVSVRFNKVYSQINAVCRYAGLPEVGVHGLRRSFASLAYHLGWQERRTMQIGGWSDYQTMHNIYIKLDSSDLADAAEKMRNFYSFTDENTDEFQKVL
ncbi:MAG: tyrosine-type recombinase/integrase [Oscillospiraceae bacterium]|jgi:integrase